jgi:hypothetical protein
LMKFFMHGFVRWISMSVHHSTNFTLYCSKLLLSNIL